MLPSPRRGVNTFDRAGLDFFYHDELTRVCLAGSLVKAIGDRIGIAGNLEQVGAGHIGGQEGSPEAGSSARHQGFRYTVRHFRYMHRRFRNLVPAFGKSAFIPAMLSGCLRDGGRRKIARQLGSVVGR